MISLVSSDFRVTLHFFLTLGGGFCGQVGQTTFTTKSRPHAHAPFEVPGINAGDVSPFVAQHIEQGSSGQTQFFAVRPQEQRGVRVRRRV